MRFRTVAGMAAVLALASACRSDPVPVRTVDIRIAADEAFRAGTEWRETLRSRLQAVSSAYEKNLGIRWRLVDIIEWTPPDTARTSEALLRDLRRHIPTDGADIVAGVTLRSIVEEDLGKAVPFDRVLLVREFAERGEHENVAALAHQLAHVFGAQHGPDESSVMHPRPTRLGFDRHTRSVITLFREVEFHRGPEGVDVARARAWAELLAAPDGGGLSRQRALLTVGMIFRASSQRATAAALFEDAIQAAPENADAHYLLGLARTDLDHREEAMAAFEEAVRLDPTLTEARVNLGILLVRAGRHADALRHFRAAVDTAPDHADARFNLGVALLAHLGQLDEAIRQFEAAVELQPSYEEARRALMAARQKRRAFEHRVADGQARIQKEPGNPAAHYSLGLAYSDAGRHQEAVRAYETAVRLRPDYRAALSNLAVSYFALGDRGNARKAVERLKAAGGTPPEGLRRALDGVGHGEPAAGAAPAR